MCPLFMSALLVFTIFLFSNAFSLLFSPCFFSLCLLTLSYVSSVFFLVRNPFLISFIFPEKQYFFHLFIPFCKTFFVRSPFFVSLFSFFFQSCSFKQDNETFFLTPKHLFQTPPRIYFLNFCYLTSEQKKSSFIIFRICFLKSFFFLQKK